MRRGLLIIILFLSLPLAFWAGYKVRDAKGYIVLPPNTNSDKEYDISDSFYQNGGSQAELNEAAYKEYERADEKLNEIYRTIFREYKGEKLFLEKLKETERLWIKYRDAYMESRFPGEDKQFIYGSVYPMAYYYVKAQKTWERVRELDEWLNYQEGDVTAGSIGMK